MIIIAEDSRFKTHHGIDFVELQDAWAAGGHRGASTITQQLAKNLYLSPSRSLLRKLKEAVTAVRLEMALSKERIMELYLSTSEWGPGVWGAAAASEAYFGVPPSRLSNAQAATLAATLPQPLTSNPAYRPGRMLSRRDLILARFYGGRVAVPRAVEETLPLVPPVIEDLMDSLQVIPLPDTIPARDSSVHQP
jgi:monofunctional biosynthetic peptidoglycan transglycosylase